MNASLLAEISRGGIKNIEVWCAHPHFNYAEEQAIRGLATGVAPVMITDPNSGPSA